MRADLIVAVEAALPPLPLRAAAIHRRVDCWSEKYIDRALRCLVRDGRAATVLVVNKRGHPVRLYARPARAMLPPPARTTTGPMTGPMTGATQMPDTDADEYHLIDTATGQSRGGFVSLDAARQYARAEAIATWEIWHGNRPVERHHPEQP